MVQLTENLHVCVRLSNELI